MIAPLLALTLALYGPSTPCPLRQQDTGSTPRAAAPTPPVPPVPPTAPVPPTPPLPPGPLPRLFGHWPDDPGAVSVSADQSIDDAITEIAESAHWNLVLNTGSEGESDIPSALSQLAPQAALSAVLERTPLVATRVGSVVVVHPQQISSGDPLQGSGITATGAPLDARADERIDAAVTRIATAAGWSVVSNTDEAGDALVRLRFTHVPPEEALRALLTGTSLGAHQAGSIVTVAGRDGLAHAPVLTGFDVGGKTVTLAGKKRVDATLERIAQAAGWTLRLDTEDSGDALLVLDLRAVPVEQALAAVIAGTPLVGQKSGNQVSVTSADSPPGAAEAGPVALDGDVLRGFDDDLDEEFTGDFDDTPVDQALRKVADSAELSLVLPHALHGTVTAHFHDAPVEDVLRAILSQNGLIATKRGSVITIERRTASTTRERMNVDALVQRVEHAVKRSLDRQTNHADPDVDADQQGADAPSHAGDHTTRGNLVLGAGEKARDLVTFMGNVKLEPGSHARQVTVFDGSIDIGPGAVVEREATAFGGSVHVSPGARVGEEATAFGGKVSIDPGASVKDRTSFHVPGLSSLGHTVEEASKPSFSPLLALGSMLAEFALYFALGLILLVFWPRRLERVASAVLLTPARSTAVGMLGMMAVPVLTVLLIVTVAGIPLILVEVIGLLFGEVLGLSALALVIGRRLPIDVGRHASAINLAMGTGALVAATNLPYIGWLLKACACVLVLGAVVSTRFGHTETTPDAPLADPVA